MAEASARPLVELTKWRTREFLRQPEAMFWVFAFPLLLAFALGLAFKNRGPRTMRVAVEQGPDAEALARVLDASDGIEATIMTPDEAGNALRTGKVPLVVASEETLVFRYDSTREESLLARLVANDALQRAEGRSDVRAVRSLGVSEPGARYIDFLIPGLLGLNIMGTGMWGVGFSIVHTRSHMLLKRFVATPMRKSHFLLGYMFSRLVFLAGEVAVLVAFGHFVFGVPVRGSIAALSIVSVLGALAFAGIGVLVASRAKTIEAVSGMMNLVMVPMWVLSGVFFSAAAFPDVMQPVIQALPLTALNDALRAVLLDGASLFAITGWLALLAAWTIGSFGVALKIFRWG